MALYEIGISTARIRGLNKEPYYFGEKNYFAWKIKFSKASTIWLNDLPFIYLGKDIDEANETVTKYKNVFLGAQIYENDLVAVIFDINHKNKIIAISLLGKDMWVDVRDEFQVKKFSELGIEVQSLKIY